VFVSFWLAAVAPESDNRAVKKIDVNRRIKECSSVILDTINPICWEFVA
jgi:hypothetical protein